MIEALDISRFRNSEFLQYCNDFSRLVMRNNPDELSVRPQYDDLIAITGELEVLYKTSTQNPITGEIEAADLRRDRAIIGITSVINGYTYHYDQVKVKAAKLLNKNIKMYGGGIARENYMSETTILNNIVTDWSTKPEMSEAVTTLGLSEWLIEMSDANMAFNDLYIDRTQDYATASSDNLKIKRAQATHAYQELRKFLNAFSIIQNKPEYAKVINELNSLIEQYETMLHGRHSASDKADENQPPKES